MDIKKLIVKNKAMKNKKENVKDASVKPSVLGIDEIEAEFKENPSIIKESTSPKEPKVKKQSAEAPKKEGEEHTEGVREPSNTSVMERLSPRGFMLSMFSLNNKKQTASYCRYIDHLKKERAKTVEHEPERFAVSADKGLSWKNVGERIDDGFTNLTKRGSTKTIGRILWTNIMTFFNLLCFAVAGCLIYTAIAIDGSAWANMFFMVVILANISIGIIQEIKAKLTIERLSLISAQKVRTIREGVEYKLSPDDLVLDDVIVLTTGNQVPADCILLEGVMEANESLLTGESNPIAKKVGDKVLGGSFIVSGTVRLRVDAVGKANYIQTLAQGASKYNRPKSELLSSLKLIIRAIGFILVILGTVLIIRTGDNLGWDFTNSDMVTKTAGAIIGMIPAGMFLLTSMALAVGVINLAKSNTLVQELYCIEMLARVDVLCLDKTGTITDGTMKVADVVEIKNSTDYTVKEIISSMLFALEDNNQTSVALGEYFSRDCIVKATDVVPFSSARKFSAVSFAGIGTFFLGAPEFVLKDMNERVDEKIGRFASQGYRVLCLAHSKTVMKDGDLPAANGITPVALITIQDHVRKEAPETIKWFYDNGVDIKIISGDNPITVSEVAKRAGVKDADKFISLEGMTVADVRSFAKEYTVFGRVTPEQKLILVKELKNSGRTVAMTGDGVNDILALREADCSIAMATGSEAARNVSHLVLLDSNFSSMPRVVIEGRRVVNNVQKSSSLFLFKTLFTIMLVLFAIFQKDTLYIFEPKNMYMLEFLIIGMPCFFLALEMNSARIKGKFIFNVIKNSFSGAVVVVFNILLLYVFENLNLLGVNQDNFLTLCIFCTTITGFMMLFKLVQPLNVYRGILISVVVVLLVFSVFYLGGFFGLVALNEYNVLLLIIIAQACYPMVAFINNSLAKVNLTTQFK
ncbi:MAG: HAD-IC family P-type ATPase [Christensenellaceae bacterium]|jgi:cation-transporting ATPase E|nr:HAD-IC family P-type ATPase [Christensenellaceae bacterium]